MIALKFVFDVVQVICAMRKLLYYVANLFFLLVYLASFFSRFCNFQAPR